MVPVQEGIDLARRTVSPQRTPASVIDVGSDEGCEHCQDGIGDGGCATCCSS
jgi:hypothetical protein